MRGMSVCTERESSVNRSGYWVVSPSSLLSSSCGRPFGSGLSAVWAVMSMMVKMSNHLSTGNLR
jgi:hypothetical protein